MQKDLKRLVAYSSVAHMGFIVLGIFAITRQSLQGSVLQMVNHGISTGALFLLVGLIYERRHTREISELKGLQKPAPILAAVFTVVMLSSIGLPGLNGFVGEFLILLGSFLTYRWWAVVAATGVILAALYLLWAYQRVFHGEPDEANANDAATSGSPRAWCWPRWSASSCSWASTPSRSSTASSPRSTQLVAARRGQLATTRSPRSPPRATRSCPSPSAAAEAEAEHGERGRRP